jgi:hypothetical protein
VTTINAVGNGLSGATGTGKFVGDTSPTIVTPVIAQINDANGNKMLLFSSTPSAVNKVTIVNASTGTSPIIEGTGNDTNVILTINGQGNGGVAIHGTGTNDSAGAGYVGELITSSATGVSLSTATPKSITSILVTAGDWDIWGRFQAAFTGTMTGMICSASTTNNVTSASYQGWSITNTAGLSTPAIVCPLQPLSFSSSTTVYLVGESFFSSGTCTGSGEIYARRVR